MSRATPLKSSFLYFGFLFSLNIFSIARAEKMDLEAHDLVISKLESSLKIIPMSDQAIDTIGLRLQLANLYADKARLLLIEEGHKNCDGCLQSKNFRQKAITLYQQIQPKLDGTDSDQVSIQLAHLYETTNRNTDALKIYDRLIKSEKTSPPFKSQALSKRADFYFREGQFDKALSDYKIVIVQVPKNQQGTIIHKMAWSNYNKGELDLAISQLTQILKNEQLLQQPTAGGYQYSEAFHSEVAHDLALFMAKDTISKSSVDRLVVLGPKEDRVTNLLFLGDEAERVGQTDGAQIAWEKALSLEGFPPEKKSKVLLSIARFHRDNFRFEKAKLFYSQALELAASIHGNKLGTKKCLDLCAENQQNLKQFLVQWEKQASKLTKPEKIRISLFALMQTYELYHKVQSSDYETFLWLAQLARKLNQKEIARKSYAHAADLLSENETLKADSARKFLEAALLAEIEIAEDSRSLSSRLESYDHYLKLNPNGPANFNVRYQRAKVFYDQNKYDKAFELYDQLVENNQFKNTELKLKSAHLALDSLVLLKDIEKLESKSIEYGNRFPKEALVFHKISRKAGLEIASSMTRKNGSANDAAKALQKLETVTLVGADPKETKSILQMRIDLAIKAQKFEVAQNNLSRFINRSDLSNQEIKWALTKRLSLAELLLDFKTAFQTVQRMDYQKSQNPKELLKGALLAELVGSNPKPWLEKVIKSPHSSREQSHLARAQLIRLAKNQWMALRTQGKELLKFPSLFADLALECFNNNSNLEEARWAVSQKGVARTEGGILLSRQIEISDLQKLGVQVQNLKLNSKTDALVASSLKSRIKGLSNLKNSLRHSQRQQDWTLQVLSATILKSENERLALDIELLPIPKRLTITDQKAYRAALADQARPFRSNASELELFLKQSWENPTYVNTLLQKIDANERIRNVLMNELRYLAKVAPETKVAEIKSQLAEFKKRPTLSEISSAQDNLRKDPFDLDRQNELLSMEKKLGNRSMVVFLQARGNSIKGGQL